MSKPANAEMPLNIHIILTLSLGLVSVVTPAVGQQQPTGPRFDCSKPRAPHDRLICADPKLASLVVELDKAYSDARSRLSGRGRQQLAYSQRAWIKFARAVCPTDVVAKPSSSQAPQNCLSRVYEQRIEQMKRTVRRLGPFTVVRLDAYAVARALPNDPTGSYPGFYVEEQKYEWIDVPEPAELREKAIRWNRLMVPPELLKESPRFHLSRAPVFTQSLDGNGQLADVGTTVTVYAASQDVISYSRSDWYFVHGQAHGDGTELRVTIMLDGSKELHLRDLFNEHLAWPDFLGRCVVTWLQEQGELHWEVRADEIADSLKESSDWLLSPAGLIVRYEADHSYAGSRWDVTVPWKELEPYLAPKGRRVVMGLQETPQ